MKGDEPVGQSIKGGHQSQVRKMGEGSRKQNRLIDAKAASGYGDQEEGGGRVQGKGRVGAIRERSRTYGANMDGMEYWVATATETENQG